MEPAFMWWEVWARCGPPLPPVKRQRNAKRAPVPLSERHLGVAARPPPLHRSSQGLLALGAAYAPLRTGPALSCAELGPLDE